jgi:two-component system sensor histidine kinase RegB
MPSAPCTSETSDHLANLRRLVGGRWVVLAILAQLTLVGPGLLDIPVPQVPLLGIIAIAGLFNGLAQWRVAGSARRQRLRTVRPVAVRSSAR